MAKQLLDGRFGAILTIRVGSKERAFAIMNALTIPQIVSNIGDTKTLIVHPESTLAAHSTEQEKIDAAVFDDMISRSVPFYKENLRLIVALVAKLGAQNASICDLGCSTASLLLEFWRQNAAYKLVGVDNSGAMIENARNKCAAFGAKIDFFESDLSEFDFVKSDIFIANYTLQFIRPPQRQALVRKIYENLNEKGFFIMSEKILYEDALLAKNIIEIYADFKHELV
mgnify:CR=1 FL=1